MHNLRKICLSFSLRELRRVFRQGFIQRSSRCLSTLGNPPSVTTASQFTIPKGILGQPTCHTHPHMISKDNLTCDITQAEFRERRETLVRKLAAEVENMHKTHIIVIPAARKQFMSDKIPYVFRQNSDFFYLTGCLEPSAILVMVKPAQTDSFKSILFVHEKDPHAELWEGPRTGCADAIRLFTVDEARPVENFSGYLNKMTASSKPSVLWYHNECPSNPDIHTEVRSVLRHDSQVSLGDPQRALHFMRVIKSPAEVKLMRDACYIGAQSVNMAMACTKPGVSEHAINAVLEYSCRLSGAEYAAFPPVVGGGARATHIHYVANNQILDESEMLLVDSGCQRWMYNSDISRTWPVSGQFSKYHKILYELVLSVQKRLIELVGEHRPPLDQLFDNMCRLLGARLQAEGILPKDIDQHRLIGEAYRLCPHHVSHYLGLDVHDAPLVRRATPLQTNMVVTVEPGIYIRPDDKKVPPEFRGIGIRIEDDVLITDGEPLVLTDSCVKEVSDIEAIVGKHTLKHEHVLKTVKENIARKPVSILISGYELATCHVWNAKLCKMFCLDVSLTTSFKHLQEAYRLCPHHVSHYLGLDVHDAPLVRRATPLQTNMVVTVEPGIYIRPDDKKVPPEFRGIGIRIEDDVLITDGEPLVLTDSCVKEVSDIEAIVGKHTL